MVQRVRNLVWAAISYCIVFVGIFDPTNWIHDAGKRVSITLTVAEEAAIGIAFLLGLVTTTPLLLASATLTHELGHSVAVGLTGGRVLSLKTVLDSSGLTSWSGRPSRPTRALVAGAGPLACSLLLLGTFRAIEKGIQPASLLVIAGLLVTIAITTVRSLWGWITTLLVSCAAYGVYYLLTYPELIPSEYVEFDIPRNALLLAVAVLCFNSGSSIRYSIRCRGARHAEMDEAKFAAALGMPKWLGGYLLLAANVALVAEVFKLVLF
jgi:hypothetical protein